MTYVTDISSPRRPSIGLTPLIDVVFILLVFFMLVVKFSVYQEVPLATVQATDMPLQQSAETRVVTVLSGGVCQFEETDAPCADIAAQLKGATGEKIYLAFEPGAALSEIMAAHDALIFEDLTVAMALPRREGQP